MGVSLLGLGSYVLLLAVFRHAPTSDVAAFGSFWALSFGLVGGVMLPFEQLMVRATAEGVSESSGGESSTIAPSNVLRLYLVVSVALSLGLVLGSSTLANRLLGGEQGLAYILAGYVLVSAGQSWQRGRAAGGGRLDIYGRQLGIDGGARLAVGAAFLLSDSGDVHLAALGLLVAGLVSLPFSQTPQLSAKHKTGRMRTLAREAMLLSSASTISLWLLNAGPVVVVVMGAPPMVAASFAPLFVITRVPLLFQASLQSVVLARVVTHRELGDTAGLRRSVVTAVSSVAIAGVGVIIGFGVMADAWAGLLYGPRFQLGILAGSGLALSTALFLIAAVGHVALVGLNATSRAAAAWMATAIAFVMVLLWVPGDVIERVVAAYVFAGVMLLVLQAVSLAPKMRHGPGPGQPGAGMNG